jgi:pimeloyl-ACP methyl ester carboxylesterase
MPSFRTTDSLKIYYEDAGEGYPLVLLHPWPTDHAMWMLQLAVFSEFYRIVTPDSRGLGKSDKPESGYTLERLSNDVAELLDHLKIEKAFVVGNSLGGAVAEKFAIDHTDRVKATVWVGAPTFPMDDMVMNYQGETQIPFAQVYVRELRLSYLNFWKKVWKPEMDYNFHESFVRTYIGSYLINYLFEDRYARLNADSSSLIGLLEGLDQTKSLDHDLARLEIPCAIVCGDGDDTRPSCERQHQNIPQAEFLVIPNSGHFCYLDQPEIFNKFLKDFLKRNA